MVVVLVGALAPLAVADLAEDARDHLLRGRYAEAAEAYERLIRQAAGADQQAAAVLGHAAALCESGRDVEARALLETALATLDERGDLLAELADLLYERGQLDEAADRARRAVELDERQVLARWTLTRLDRDHGRHDEANAGLDWFIRFQNREQVTDPDTVRVIGLAAAERARWHGLTNQFQFLVNRFVREQTDTEPRYWPAHYEAARLFAEKFNTADAHRAFQRALAINDASAEIYCGLAEVAVQQYEWSRARQYLDRALATNPRFVHAHRLLADLEVANFQLPQAVEHLRAARELNPVAEATLGRLAACWMVLDNGSFQQPGQRAQAVIDAVLERNPRCGEFYFAMATVLDTRQRFGDAIEAYQQATVRMPQLLGPRSDLGQLLMRMGRETEAQELLTESFRRNPFNVRVKNTLQVLEQLESYDTLETEHFIIRYRGPKDHVLALFMADFLEEQYPALCEQFGFEVPGKSLFQIFSRSERTSGHAWFSARMIGLPYLGTVGACAGKMVAMASPNESNYNWARVAKHEFVHVINLQQTDFHMPHWYAEGLAVTNEGYPPPRSWNDLVAEAAEQDNLFTLDDINLGFIRPDSGNRWQLAYAQSVLYVEFMVERFGRGAIAQLLEAYAAGHETPQAIQQAFDVTVEEFEAGYQEYVARWIERHPPRAAAQQAEDPARLRQAATDNPQDPDAQAAWAQVLLIQEDLPAARRHAQAALAEQEHHPLASYVMARLVLTIGDVEQAERLIRAAHNTDQPHPEVLNLLALLETRAKKYDQAAELYRLGRQHWPHDTKWLQGLARVYLLAQDTQRLPEVLEELANLNADDFAVRKKLAELARQREDLDETMRWCREAIFCNCLDAEVHIWWAEAAAAAGDTPRVIRQREALARLNPTNTGAWVAWAKALLDADRRDEAQSVLETLLQARPDAPEAEELWNQIVKPEAKRPSP